MSRDEIRTCCRDRKIKIVASRANPVPAAGLIEDAARTQRTKLCSEVDLTVPIALVVGRESTGIPESTEADEFVHIPMAKGVQSLNVAVATAILLYEALRQRGFTFSKP
jgi:tRNA G18 (ribose-2'-O)-methylase SpoU